MKRTGAAAIILAVLSSSPLLAQPSRERNPTFTAARQIAADLLKATFHRGPFYLLSSFQLADIGFDQQISFPTEEQVGGFGIGVSAPQRLYFVPRRKLVFSVDAVPSYHWFSGSGRDNQLGYALRGDVHVLLNHLYLDVFALTADQLQASTVEVNRLVTQRQVQTGVAGEFRYSTRTNVTFGGTFRDASFPISRVQPRDRDIGRLERSELQVQAGLLHKTFPLTSLFANVQGVRYDFVVADESDSRRTYVSGGFDFDNSRTSLRTEVGPAVLDFERAGREDFRGVLGNVSVSRRIGQRWQASAQGIRDLDFSITPENSYYIADRLLTGLEYAATRRLTVRGGTQAGRDTYPVPVDGQRRRDDFTFSSVGWTYTMRRLRGGFDVGYYDRRSNVEVDEQNGIRVLVHLSFTP